MFWFNTSWPSDAIWPHRSGSTLAQVMAWCLMAPSHYLNQCWFTISEVLCHSPKSNLTVSARAIILHDEFENHILMPHLPGVNELTHHIRHIRADLRHGKLFTYICQLPLCSRIHLTNGLWAQYPNLMKIWIDLTWKTMTKSGQNFAHVTSTKLSWQICDLIDLLQSKLEQNNFYFQIWA